MTKHPVAEKLRATAALMRQRAGAVEAEMADPGNRYWGGTGAERYREGVTGGLGGASGELAAGFDPDTVRAIAALLECEASFIDAQVFPRSDPVIERYPLAVARAYLGEEVVPA